MSEKAQEVRKRRLESMAYLREHAEIVFNFILNELDARTAKKNYSSVKLHIFDLGTPYIDYGNDTKMCADGAIGLDDHNLFFKIIADMFNTEEGYSAKIENKGILTLIVNIDVV